MAGVQLVDVHLPTTEAHYRAVTLHRPEADRALPLQQLKIRLPTAARTLQSSMTSAPVVPSADGAAQAG
jgi:hypothetical protein